MDHKFKKILAENEHGYKHSAVYEYRGFKMKNDIRFTYGSWKAWGVDSNGKNIEFHSANKRSRVAWDIDRYLDEGRNDLAYEILNF